MVSLFTTTASGETYVIYVSPISTSVGTIFTLASTICYTDSAGKTTTSSIYLPQTTTLYETLSSPAGTFTTTHGVSTTIIEYLIGTSYVPISTLSTFEHGETVTSTLYGQSDIYSASTTYVTAKSLSTTSSISPIQTSIVPTAPVSLSTGAKVGIGVGVTLAILIVAAIAFGWFLVRRRRKASAQLTEVAPASHGAYDKPELDASEAPNLFAGHTSDGKREKAAHNTSQSSLYNKTERNEVELDAAGRLKADGRAELEGRMLPRSDVIKRKEVGNVKARGVVDDKEVLHEA